MTMLTTIAVIVFLFAAIIWVIAFIVKNMLNDWDVTIRMLTSSSTRLIHRSLAKVKTMANNNQYLVLASQGPLLFKELPLPPEEAIDYNPKKRKKVVEAWFDSEKGIMYIKDGGPISGFDPFPTKHRTMLINQIKKKEERKRHDWKEHLPLYVGLGALVILVAIFLIFWGEAIKPMQELGQTLTQAIERADQLYRSQSGQQVITNPAP